MSDGSHMLEKSKMHVVCAALYWTACCVNVLPQTLNLTFCPSPLLHVFIYPKDISDTCKVTCAMKSWLVNPVYFSLSLSFLSLSPFLCHTDALSLSL